MKLLIMQPPPVSCYIFPLRHKYLPRHPILEHPHLMCRPQCTRPTQNNRENYSSEYFNLHIFGQQTA
jgi:hypothetical protein